MNKKIKELLAKIEKIESDPENRNPQGSFYIFKANARDRIDRLRRSIADEMAEQRGRDGNPVPCNGYSGRQSNKRR